MTQEEKFKEAKRLYETANADQRYVLESLFPELKESEDERIRKYLKHIIGEWSYDDLSTKGFRKEDIIAWIERQGEQKAWSKEDKNMLKWVIGYLENKMLNTPISEERTACKNAIAWLEEKLKGEQKTNPCDGCINRKGCINCENGELRETEQKPVDTVEPKFKVGDIIKHNKVNAICKVISVNSGSYYIENIETNGRIKLFSAEQNFHLWTIQDAKDGDVLATLNQILIFEKILHKDGGVSHCHYDFGCSTPQFNFNKDDNWYFGKEAKVYPATKEQRDLLFTKMKEAGYKWDAEKKELKKIEQKQEWSEEDEEMFGYALDMIEWYSGKNEKRVRLVSNWLKSLKDRVQSQPQWEPSDEQMKVLEELVEDNNQRHFYTILRSLYEQLKKLREE